MEELVKKLREAGCTVRQNEPMRLHTSFQVGGPADCFVIVHNLAQLQAAAGYIHTAGMPLFLLGNGSNLLVSDLGVRGAVLCLDGEFKEMRVLEDGVTVEAGAGATLAALCKFARDHSLRGLEFAYGIPGSVGGAVFMNAGAYGGEMKDVLLESTHLCADGSLGSHSLAELDLGYRKSRYQTEEKLITGASFRLEKGDKTEIGDKMDALMQKRVEKQPYDMPSGGSTFKRPAGAFAAALIEQCGLKGHACGKARVSEKHAGFVVNSGGATCAEVLRVIAQVRDRVYAQTGIRLECEIRLLGEGFSQGDS